MLYKKCAYFRMEDIGAYKASTIFVSQPFTVYEVDFFDSWYDFGWLQNRQSLCLDFFLILQKVGCSTQILSLFRQWFLALKPFLACFFQKNDLLKWIVLVFVYLTDWIFEYIFPSFIIFCGSESFMAAQCFWNVDLSWDVNLRTQHTFCWGGKKVL